MATFNGGGGGYFLDPRSRASASFALPVRRKGESVAPELPRDWTNTDRAADEFFPHGRVAFGHSPLDDSRVAAYGGKMQQITMFRPLAEMAIHKGAESICPKLAEIYQPWWPLTSSGEPLKHAERPVAPTIVSDFCSSKSSVNQWKPLHHRPDAAAHHTRWFSHLPNSPLHLGTTPLPHPLPGVQGKNVASALKNIADMPWFGVLNHWAGSMCLLHFVTEWRWPSEKRSACGGLAPAINFTALTRGPAMSEAEVYGRTKTSNYQLTKLRGHQGMEPSKLNGNSSCPIHAAEMMLKTSTTRVFSEWILEDIPELVSFLLPTSSPSDENVVSLDPSSPFCNLIVDSRGADATLTAWVENAFDYRMRDAARALAEKGYSATNWPSFLSPDCFTKPAPDGFLVA